MGSLFWEEPKVGSEDGSEDMTVTVWALGAAFDSGWQADPKEWVNLRACVTEKLGSESSENLKSWKDLIYLFCC